MIGQREVLKQIDNLIEKGFPRFIAIIGQKGQGKTTLAKEISNRLKIPICEFSTKIDDIREMIAMSYKQTEPIIYLIQNADKMSIGAKNSLLKVIEEPPNSAFFIMELQQIENTLETIKSRCQQIHLEDYNSLEINEMQAEINSNLESADKAIIEDIPKNYYQLKLLNQYKPLEFYNYVDKVVNNIYKVQSANAFKIGEKLDLKDNNEGYDLDLFFETFKTICMDNLIVNIDKDDEFGLYKNYNKMIDITSKYQQKLKMNRY